MHIGKTPCFKWYASGPRQGYSGLSLVGVAIPLGAAGPTSLTVHGRVHATGSPPTPALPTEDAP